MAKSKRSAEKEAFWRLAQEEFEKSGLSVQAYCLQEGLSKPSFYAWRRTIRKRDAAQVDVTCDQQTLLPVDVVDRLETDSRSCGESSQPRPPLLEVITPGGFTLRFHQDLQPRQLDALLSVIANWRGAAPC